MKNRMGLIIVLCLALPAFAQRQREEKRPEAARPAEAQHQAPQRSPEVQRVEQEHMPRANQGHLPPPPEKRQPTARPEPDRRDPIRTNNMPHVANDRWYGHDRPNDTRYRVARPYDRGRFEHVGPTYVYRVERFDPGLHRFWLPGNGYFDVASWDWPLASDWCWSCGEDYVVYDDPDHPGWYLLYNMHTGQYVHAMFMGM